jgi:hypothetical protein
MFCVASLNRVQGTAGKHEQSFAIGTSKQKLRWPVWNVDGIDQIARLIVYVHLTSGDVRISSCQWEPRMDCDRSYWIN